MSRIVEDVPKQSMGLSPAALARRLPLKEELCFSEDFDEFCDPNSPKAITYEDVLEAAEIVKKHLSITPCIPSHYQQKYAMNLFYKLESVQTTGSFKARGALYALDKLPLDKQKMGIIIASVGNQAVGVCHYAKILGIPVTVVMPVMVPIMKLQICHNYGAKVIIQGNNLLEAQRYARQLARDRGITFINGRDYPNIIAGYGTVALEILDQVPAVDAILVPVGTGGLAAGIATVVKHLKPSCAIYGVQPEKMPTFFKSLEAGEILTLPWQTSLAEAIAMSTVGVNSFYMLQPLLDKMLLVQEDWIARAVLHLAEKERVIVEGAGACPLAAVLGNLIPELKLKNVVCICTGGNIDTILLGRCLDRGLAAEGRLVKFKVGIKDKPSAHEQLLRLLAKGRYNVVRQFWDRVWVENDIYRVEVKLVCETIGLEHALELKRMVEKAYPLTAVFETEPFNDKRTCPCYVRKSL